MDPFAVIIFGFVGALLLFVIALGIWYPGDGTDQIDWKPTRSAEQEAQNEVDDLDQLLAAANARRRARGREELTEESVRAELAAEERERSSTRDERVIELEVVQMLERKNERRRRRGLPEITREEWEAKLRSEGRL